MKFLVVDDDFLILDLMEEFLSIEKHDVVTSSNPAEALNIASKDRPDCVLVDVVMPEINGYDFYRKIKQLYPDILFIFVSGNVNEDDIFMEFKKEIPLIKKPFTREIVMKTINKVCIS